MYYKITIDYTSKSAEEKGLDGWSHYDTQIKTFKTIEETKAYIKENYTGKNREKMYQDTAEGKTQHTGYIYKMGISSDMGRDGKPEYWYVQHWVKITSVKEVNVIL